VTVMTKFEVRRRPGRESGVVLITGLIFVVILTLIVLAVLGAGSLEERMAANAMNRQVALQAAEAVGRDAAVRLFSTSIATPIDPFDPTGFASCSNGYCYRSSNVNLSSIDWSDAKTGTFGDTSSNLNGVPAQPRFIVEPIAYDGGQPPKVCPRILFRITARGVGPGSATVFVETLHWYRPDKFANGICG
jgi:type IV pilus assembly protein PilX